MNRLATCLALISLPACTGSEPPPTDDLGYAGTGIAVTIAPLDLPSITDACYSFEVTNEGGQRVVARGGPVATDDAPVAGQGGDGGPAGLNGALANPLCSTRFGNSQGALSYVAPCDASPGSEQHTVTLWVNSVCQDGAGATLFDPTTNPGGCEPLSGFVNPCGATGCAVTATCQENADTPVSFNFTIMASAQQGFFDVAVNFDNVFCSAKLDTCHDGEPIELLHDALGTRRHTAVAAVACTAGTGDIDTTLHFSQLIVTCGEDTHSLDLGLIIQEGALAAPNPTLGGLTAAVYYGTEDLPDVNKVYTNVAFLLPPGGPCQVEWTIVPSDSPEAPQPQSGQSGTLTQVAGVRFVPEQATVQQALCHNYSLNGQGPGQGGGVVTAYLEDGAEVALNASLGAGMARFGAPMILEFDTTLTPGTTVTLQLGGPVDAQVHWGDGSVDDINSAGEWSHTFASEGTYRVAIFGQLQRFGLDGTAPNIHALTRVLSFGDLGLLSLWGAFQGAANLVYVPPTIPNGIINLRSVFQGASSFNGPLDAWDVSSVTTMAFMFANAQSFNQPIGTWDVSSVTNMSNMFNGASSFNQNISAWNIGSVNVITGMFFGASSFDQPIGGWNLQLVTNLSNMFRDAASFNQDLGPWNVAGVNNMQAIFRGATSFNGAIGGWSVGNVSNMIDMFLNAESFNRDLSGWCVAAIDPPGPMNFDFGATSWVLPRPIWGTCP